MDKIAWKKSSLTDDAGKVAAYSTLINVALLAAKAIIAFYSGSAAVLSEAVHSLTDVIASLSVWIGIKISRRKSPSFPWGLYKAENIAAVITAFFIFLMAYEIAKEAVLGELKEVSNLNLSIAALFLMAVPVYIFTWYEKKRAKELNSPSLLADAEHWVTDLLSIGVVIAGLAASRYTPYADRVAAVIVILLVVRIGYRILRDSMRSLLDASVDAGTLDKIKNTVEGFREVREVSALHARNSGSFIFVHMDLKLSARRLKEAHRSADAIEKAVRKEVPFIEEVSIHYEPVKKEFVRFAATVSGRDGAVSQHFGRAPFVALWDKDNDGKTISKEFVENPFSGLEKGKGIKLAELLVERGVDILYTMEEFSGKGPEHVFSDADVEVRLTASKNIEELLEHNAVDSDNGL
ncbi:MAG: cation diffusion facilitator family transporter [Deltaproteobacteria bacterium]|nr:cation diffusion facilitator family transporter [Deltaproteobacteria bacterium]